MSYRVLHYNWAPYFQKPTLGGGVSVYCKNLIDYTIQKDNWHVTFLYSGTDYSYFNKRPHIKPIRNQNHPHVPTFSLVNSPIIAPSHFAFDDPLGNVKQPALEKCFQEFLDTQAPFSVIHFHNLEGITANCLKIAKESGAKVVFSLHNYWAVCPQVNLWRLEQSHCDDNLDGRACLACLPIPPNSERELAMRRLEFLGNSLDLKGRSLPLNLLKKLVALFYKIQRPLVVQTRSPLLKTLELKGANLPQQAEAYQFRRQEIVSLINRYVDVALSVSDRTATIYRYYGVDPARLSTQYIGSKATQFPVPPHNPAIYSPGQPFRCVYMGVPRKDKGFYFLLEELRCLSATELSTLELVVASKIADRTELDLAMQQKGPLLSLAQSLHRLIYHPGYSHENLPKILDGIHLGIVPPLWEDNLPQVTYELLACRVPVLCSNRGGAQEFVRHPAFIFDPGKKGDFQQKLSTIRDNPHLLTEFWQEARTVRSLEQHFQELIEVYAGCGN
jgi:glycosyltransferase involved in cell wall biosynthesis